MSLPGCLKEQLELHVETIKDNYEDCRGDEAATKRALIEPLFTILGYNLGNLKECRPEYKADFGKGRSVKPVDWAFFVGDSRPKILVEAKAVGEDIGGYDEQLGDYYAKVATSAVLGILTSGVEWRFFTSPTPGHVMDKQPFLTWNILKEDPIPCDLFAILHREKFGGDEIRRFVAERHQQNRLVAELSTVLKPSPEFVSLVLNKNKDLETGQLTEAVMDKWKPILASALQEWAQKYGLKPAIGNRPPEPDGPYSNFWEPIRSKPNGLFAGKPVPLSGERWIAKSIRGINLVLSVHNHACRVELAFDTEDKKERREKVLKLLPELKDGCTSVDNPRWVSVRFPVLDKGLKDREHWPEIREKLTALGENIYRVLEKSDV